ncbi:macrolide export ATP-binding/permease protein MacB [Bradyrhizobium sp. SSBR45G]|uniref:MacB family efflux pump subunit n=1 Tax=unclassified Bradyrhizobium TaxID=2631580 RepID=UPI002342A975|nr:MULTISPECIES: MacB family efflux pump subunit [unclassified Bradyrhizobium]GLH78161.1 macrolide export ATP-binding/permease protein MacB [Bradyrhizobium sp. SSBR45G]GLH86072.1 macrolide export ATP-binding/permease protein MacB [Bradyrhizobium sp. SSBR45R]
MAELLIDLQNVGRRYASGEGTVHALRGVDIQIARGEMVAIIGQSGSGKSTLMNILGCLDRPTSGTYRIAGREMGSLDPDELAALRREHFGFIFQRYHLLGELTAAENAEVPAVYAGLAPAARRGKAAALLQRLGMGGRAGHTPGQLSGGQQQRVSIARALVNDPDVILADEPTGALDRASGDEVLRILDEISASGRTVIIVTHDAGVAQRARRIIEIQDGRVISDRLNPRSPAHAPATAAEVPTASASSWWRSYLDRFREAARMALLAMNAHRMRAFLTMLGIIIGVASVVLVLALGSGSQAKVLKDINRLGTNTLEFFPGKDFGDTKSSKIRTLVLGDAKVMAQQPYVDAISPTVSTTSTLRYGATEVSAQISGVGEQYFRVKNTELAEGSYLDADTVRSYAQDAVIDDNARKALFPDPDLSPLGSVILIGKVPCRIVGVTKQQQAGFGSSSTPIVYLPYTTVQARFIGNQVLRSISVRVDEATPMADAERAATALLTARHNTKDFFVLNTDDIRKTVESTTQVLTLLVAAIAVISLLVGGIGVMNIMLVSVSERVGEIGVRMAVGARRSDILMQFLIEAVLVCLLGGALGLALAVGFGVVFNALDVGFQLIYSPLAMVGSAVISMAIGIGFGYMPARNASRLDPATALARE